MRQITLAMDVTEEEFTSLLNSIGNKTIPAIQGEEIPPIPEFLKRNHGDVPAPAAVPTPTAPTASTAPVAATTSTEVDTKGTPWDARFHAGTKNMTAKGVWKARKGMTAEEKAQAEAHATAHAGQAAPVAPAPPTAAAPVAPAPPTAAATLPAATPPAPTLPMPTAPTSLEPVSFEDLTEVFGEVIAAVGNDTLMANLGAIYANAGCSPDGVECQSDETARRKVVEGLRALAG